MSSASDARPPAPEPRAIDPKSFDPGPLLDARAELVEHRWIVTLQRDFAHPPERVWVALTDPAAVRAWAPFAPDRDLAAVGEATLTMIDGDTRVDLPSAVSRADPPHRLEYTWGTDRLAWVLEPTPAGTRLTLQHAVEGQDWMPRVAAGWHLCLIVAQRMLDGDPIESIVGHDAMHYGWQDLHDAYAVRLIGEDVIPA